MLNYDSGKDDCCQVLIDNEEVGYIAARHLIDRGRTRLAFVGGRDYLQPVALRRRGVRRAVEEEGGRVSLQEVPTENLDPPGGLRAGEELAGEVRAGRLDGVIASRSPTSSGWPSSRSSTRTASRYGGRGVMGCDHNSAAWGGMIPLTSVQMQGLDMGREAVRLLMAEIEDGPITSTPRRCSSPNSWSGEHGRPPGGCDPGL